MASFGFCTKMLGAEKALVALSKSSVDSTRLSSMSPFRNVTFVPSGENAGVCTYLIVKPVAGTAKPVLVSTSDDVKPASEYTPRMILVGQAPGGRPLVRAFAPSGVSPANGNVRPGAPERRALIVPAGERS